MPKSPSGTQVPIKGTSSGKTEIVRRQGSQKVPGTNMSVKSVQGGRVVVK